MTEKNAGQGNIVLTTVDMGAVFILGGLAFAVGGGLLYYFLSKQDSDETPQKENKQKEIEPVQTEV
jgi:hypothetical protein